MDAISSVRVATGGTKATAGEGAKLPEVSTGVSNTLRILGGAAATGIGAGIGALLSHRTGYMGWKSGAMMGAFVGATIGAIGNAATWGVGRANVGTVDGSYHWQEKVGEEAYTTTCTSTFSDSDGTHTHTYPCTKVRGIYEDRWSDTTQDLKVQRKVAEGTLEEVVARVDAKDKGVFVVIRTDGHYQAHAFSDGIIDFPDRWDLVDPGAVAVIDVRNGGYDVADIGPNVTSEERAALQR